MRGPLSVFPAVLLACAAAGAQYLSLAAPVPWLAFVGWTPLLLALERQSVRRALLLGALHGLALHALGFAWLPALLGTFAGANPLLCAAGTLLVCAWHAGRSVLLALLYRSLRARAWNIPLACAASVALGEWAYPSLLEWHSAAALHDAPFFLQLADVGGPVLVGAALSGSSAALAMALLHAGERARYTRSAWGCAVGLPCAMVVYGLIRTPQIERRMDEASAVRAGIVQPNARSRGLKARPSTLVERTRRLVTEGGAEFVVWPETSIAGVLPAEGTAGALRMQLGEKLASPVIAGALLARAAPGVVRDTYNVALLVTPDVGVGGVYRKMRPLVVGEYLPLGDLFPSLYARMPNAGRVAAGEAATGLDVGGHRVAALICYEDLLGGFARDVAGATDAELLVSLSNDDWFQSALVSRAHAALATFLAIEQRRFLVRGTNNGPSAVIDALGRARGETRFGADEAVVQEARWMHGTTVFCAIGDAPWWCCAVVVAVALLRRRARGASSGSSSRRGVGEWGDGESSRRGARAGRRGVVVGWLRHEP